MKKIFIKRIGNEGNYNDLDIEKSKVFLDNLQDFVVDIGVAKVEEAYYFGDKNFDMNTFYSLFYEDVNCDYETKKRGINTFGDGEIIRYHNREIELLIIFYCDFIKLIFYCNFKNRKKIIDSLFKFCRIRKVRKK